MRTTQKKGQSQYHPCLRGFKQRPLPKELAALLEQLAEHVHDGWSCQRLKQGWTRGARRNDLTKEHPNLVPYADLTEAEKNLDRKAAAEVLRAILAMGYRITK